MDNEPTTYLVRTAISIVRIQLATAAFTVGKVVVGLKILVAGDLGDVVPLLATILAFTILVHPSKAVERRIRVGRQLRACHEGRYVVEVDETYLMRGKTVAANNTKRPLSCILDLHSSIKS